MPALRRPLATPVTPMPAPSTETFSSDFEKSSHRTLMTTLNPLYKNIQMPPLIVQKYGGKCLATVQAIKSVAARTARLRHEGKKILVVVSAMGQSTDELVRLAYQVSAKPNRREMDMLLTTGERVSMALLSMALQDLGIPAISFTGSQAGVLTDDSHSQARIINIQAPRVTEALDKNQVVVLAGFQGVSPTRKEVTTLGRGGSDTTAVAMAGYLKADRCEILKDVNGICSADPKIIPAPKTYQQLPFELVREMCFWGAKVLHLRAVELAEKLAIPLFVGSATDASQGTLVTKESKMFEKEQILAINSHGIVAHIQVQGDSAMASMNKLQKFLSEESLPFPLVVASEYSEGFCKMVITNDDESLNALLRIGETKGVLRNMNHVLSSVTVTGFGLHGSDLLARMLETLAAQAVPVVKTLMSASSISVFVMPAYREKAVQVLHGFVG